jgi:hypothetical protein
MGGGYHYTLGNLGWRYSPTEKLLMVNHAAWMREKFDNYNPTNLPLGAGYYGEWVWNTTPPGCGTSDPARRGLVRAPPARRRISATSTRRIRRCRACSTIPTAPRCARAATCSSPGWPGSGRLHFTAGARWDHHSIDGARWSPRKPPRPST